MVSQLTEPPPLAGGGLRPNRIYIDAAVQGWQFVKSLCERLVGVPTEIVEDFRWFHYPADFVQAKRYWCLARPSCPLVRALPPAPDGTARCAAELANNTPYDCSYSPLRVTLGKQPLLRIGVAIESLLAELAGRAGKAPQRALRVEVGRKHDALALDDMTQIAGRLVGLAGLIPNCTVDLRTRTDNIGQLLKLPHHGRTIVTFAVNPRALLGSEERGTASLVARLAAARRLLNAGYRIGFAIDPIIRCPGWEKLYTELLDEIFTHVGPEECEGIDCVSLHYPRGLPAAALRAFPGTQIFFGEFVPIRGIYRYFRPVREATDRWFAAALSQREVRQQECVSA